MSALRAVVVKEWFDALRDRRSLFSALIFPLVGPILVGVMFTTISHTFSADEEDELPVAGAQHAPQLIAYLESAGLAVIDPPADVEAAVRDGDVDAVLVIDEGFGEAFASGHSAPVRLVVDRSRTSAAALRRRVGGALDAYGMRVASLRLLARGVHPEVVRPVEVSVHDLATAEKKSANILLVVPIFVIMATFIGGMHVAIDSTAGERERGSMEPLLLNPVPTMTLVTGKWLVTVAFSVVSAVLTLMFSGLVLMLVPLEDLGIGLRAGPAEALLILLAVLPLAPLASGLQLLVSTFARSFKEAQTYLSLLLFLPMIPGFIGSILPLRTALWMYPVPALSQQVLITEVLRAEPTSWLGFVVAGGTTIALGLVCVWATSLVFRRERIIFTGQ